MNKLIKGIFLVVIVGVLAPVSPARAAKKALGDDFFEVAIDKELKEFQPVNLQEAEANKALGKKIKKGTLADLKLSELRKEWTRCRDLAGVLLPKNRTIEFWLWETRLDCGRQAALSQKQIKPLAKVWHEFPVDKWQTGPWKEALSTVWMKIAKDIVEGSKEQASEVMAVAKRVLQANAFVGKNDLIWAYGKIAEVEAASGNKERAAFYFRLAGDLGKDVKFMNRYEELSGFRLPEKADYKEAFVGAESETWTEVDALLKKKQPLDAARAMVLLQKRFPGTRSAALVSERLMKMAADIFEQDNNELTLAFAAVLKEADPLRQAEWAAIAHKRTDDVLCLELSESALTTLGTSPNAAKLLWMAGRSAHFLGDYDRAVRNFDQLVQFHGVSEESNEALLRMALIHLRQDHATMATRWLDRLIDRKTDKWDLSARYWRVRSIQTADPDLAKQEADQLIVQYPFSYYGLILRSEKEGGILKFVKTDRSPLETRGAHLWLTSETKKIWERFKLLTREGWSQEAQAELAALPTPADPWSTLQWAKLLAASNQYATAIPLMNRALEEEPSLRHPRYIESGFPKIFLSLIQTESAKQQVSPTLVRSLIRQESAFIPRATSSSNALGLMQMIAPTAKDVAKELGLTIEWPDDMYRPATNIPMGTYYIAKVIRDFDGQVPMGLAGYNAGPSRIKKWFKKRGILSQPATSEGAFSWKDEIWFDELPWSETSFYVKAILRNSLLEQVLEKDEIPVKIGFWSTFVENSALKTTENPADKTTEKLKN